jgi:hypothetical protein
VVILHANDGSASHAFVVVDDIIFDATQPHALKLCRKSFEWICGKHGMGDIERALCLEKPYKTEKRYVRIMAKNW